MAEQFNHQLPRSCATAQPVAERLDHLAPVWLAIVLLATCVAYWPAMKGAPLWDDDAHLTKLELQSASGLVRIWTDPAATQQYYPLLHSAFWLEHKLWGDSVLGYHAITLVWHLVAVLLLYSILRKLKVPGALLAAAIFALHPVMVESVAWISEQKNTLSAVFYLAALRVYLEFDESRKRSWYALSLILFVLGLLTKTVTATLPAALLVAFWWQRGAIAWKRDFLPLAPFFALGAVAGVVTAWVEYQLIGARGESFEMSLVQRCLLAGRVPWFYLSKILFPVNLIFIYPRWNIDPRVWWQWLFPLATLGVLVVLWAIRKRWRSPLAAWLLFVSTLLPVLGFLNVYPFVFSFVADHYQYLASIGMIVLAAAGTALGLSRLSPNSRKVGVAGCILLLAAYSVLTFRQSQMYADSIRLYEATIARNPDCWMAHNNLGMSLMSHGRQQAAITHFQDAVRVKPDYVEAHINLGGASIQVGALQQGIDHLREAIRLDPTRTDALNSLGYALVKNGEAEQGIAHLREAIRRNPAYFDAHNNLGEALAGMGQTQPAIDCYREALRLNPNSYEAHCNLGVALVMTGDVQAGVDQYRAAIRVNPHHSAAHINLGDVLLQTGDSAAAIEEYQAALRARPNDVRALNSLARALMRLNRFAEAESPARRALQVKPDDIAAHINLGAILTSTGKLPQAIEQFETALKLDSNRFEVHNQLGFLYFQTGDAEKALAHFREALRLRPDSADTEINIGQVLRQAGRAEEAVGHFESALRRNPNHLQAYDNLARALIALKRSDEAVATYQRGIAAAQSARLAVAAAQLEDALRAYQSELLQNRDDKPEPKQ
jgi:tetratricopeptide (TPR) repeat protein